MGTLVDRMIATIPEEWIRLGSEVGFVSYGDEGWLVGTEKGVERFDAVLMAAPVDVARSLLKPVDARAAELMEMECELGCCGGVRVSGCHEVCSSAGFWVSGAAWFGQSATGVYFC